MRRTIDCVAATLLGWWLFPVTLHADDTPVGASSALSPSSSAKEVRAPLTLAEAYAWAARESPSLKVLGLDAPWSEARLAGARAHPNPEVELGVEDFRTGRRAGEDAFEAYTVGLSQPIEWFGKRSARQAVADAEVRGRRLETALKRGQHRLAIAEAVVKCAQLQRLTVLSRERWALAERLSDIATERVKAGKISSLEEAQLLTNSLLARAESEEHDAQLVAVRAELATLLGARPDAFGEIAFDLETPPPEPVPVAPENPSSNLAFRKADNDVERARAQLALERHSVVPDLTLSVEMTLPRTSKQPLFSAGVGVPLPLFDRNQGARGEAAVMAEVAPLLAQGERSSQVQELARSRAELVSALRKARVLKEGALTTLQRNQASLEAAYAQGRLGYLDVVSNQESLSSMREKHLEALVQAHVSSLRVATLLVSEESPMPETAVPSDPRARP